MIYVGIIALVWIYLYMWNYSVNHFKFNNENLPQTIILAIVFLPVELTIISIIIGIGIILGLSLIILLPIKNNIFYRLFRGYVSVIKDLIKNYLDCIKIFNILNDYDKNTNYYNVPNSNLLVNYLVSILKCQVSIETFEHVVKDFIEKYNNGMSVLKWIEQDNFLSEE